jgi:hypothetical protein
VDWWTQRIVTSEDYRGTSPRAVREEWSFADVLEAHMTLDALEEIRAIARPDPPGPGR